MKKGRVGRGNEEKRGGNTELKITKGYSMYRGIGIGV